MDQFYKQISHRGVSPRERTVVVLDSVIPLLHHTGSWRSVLEAMDTVRSTCHVLIIRLLCDALSPERIQSLERRASAILRDTVLLRRGVHEYDQWLRDDMLQTVAETKVTTKDVPTPSGKIFLRSDDPDLEYLEDDEDPDDDLDL